MGALQSYEWDKEVVFRQATTEAQSPLVPGRLAVAGLSDLCEVEMW